MDRKILVTGSSAVAGSAFKTIRDDYAETGFIFSSANECDLTDIKQTITYVQDVHPAAIIHLAAVSGGIGLSMKRQASLMRDNTLMIFSVLEAARRSGVDKTIMTLSGGMYPAKAPLPLNEDNIHDGQAHESNYGYAFAKRLIEPAVRSYREEYGLSVIGLIPSGIFGENDNFNENDAPMLPGLIRRFYENRNAESKIIVWGDGAPLREYTYSSDIARIYMWALDNYDDPQVLNIGSTEEHSVKEIAFMIADIMGIDKGRIEFDKNKPSGIFRKNMDNSRFIGLSNLRYTPFREGLEKTISWYVETAENNPEKLRH